MKHNDIALCRHYGLLSRPETFLGVTCPTKQRMHAHNLCQWLLSLLLNFRVWLGRHFDCILMGIIKGLNANTLNWSETIVCLHHSFGLWCATGSMLMRKQFCPFPTRSDGASCTMKFFSRFQDRFFISSTWDVLKSNLFSRAKQGKRTERACNKNHEFFNFGVLVRA